MTAAGNKPTPGFRGRDEQRRQQCLRCWGWKYPATHSCPGVPQAGRTPPPAPQRIQRRRTKGWRTPDNAVYVGRPTLWGNPFSVAGAREAGYLGTDAELSAMCAHQYRTWLARTDLGDQDRYTSADGRSYDRIKVLARLHELAGRDLACWCPLGQPCHADTLLDLANDRELLPR